MRFHSVMITVSLQEGKKGRRKEKKKNRLPVVIFVSSFFLFVFGALRSDDRPLAYFQHVLQSVTLPSSFFHTCFPHPHTSLFSDFFFSYSPPSFKYVCVSWTASASHAVSPLHQTGRGGGVLTRHTREGIEEGYKWKRERRRENGENKTKRLKEKGESENKGGKEVNGLVGVVGDFRKEGLPGVSFLFFSFRCRWSLMASF